MKKSVLTLSAAAITLVGATGAYANHHGSKAKVDANGDGEISLAETMAHSAERFARMDADGNGQIDTADRAARKAARFAKLDANGDGEVTQAEMQAAREAHKEARTERRAERSGKRFAMLDTDGSGGLSEAEMAAAREQRGDRAKAGGKKRGGEMRGKKRAGRKGMKMLRQADANGDKIITRAEFDKAVKARFEKMDTDNSGTITREERKAAREARKAALRS